MGMIIAGSGVSEEIIEVPRTLLEKSSFTKQWLENPDAIPQKMRRGGYLCLENSEPDVVRAIIKCLAGEVVSAIHDKHLVFLVKMHDLAKTFR